MKHKSTCCDNGVNSLLYGIMKKLVILLLCSFTAMHASAQEGHVKGDSLKQAGLLAPALAAYASEYALHPSADLSYKLATTTALLWTSTMRDTSFYFLDVALREDSTLNPLFDPQFLSLIDDPRWEAVEDEQFRKYEAQNGPVRNQAFAKELFRMIVRDQGFMYAGNIERNKYMRNGGYFGTPAIFPVLAMEEKNLHENERRLLELLDNYGWPYASVVTEYAAAGAALVINHASYEIRSAYFPMLEKAFNDGEAEPLLYAKMRDRLLVEEGKSQLYGTQIRFNGMIRELYPILEPHYVDQRRSAIGLGPLKPYLKERFGIDWDVAQERN